MAKLVDSHEVRPHGTAKLAPQLVIAYVAAYAREHAGGPESEHESPLRQRDIDAVQMAAEELRFVASNLERGAVTGVPPSTRGFNSPSCAAPWHVGSLALRALGLTVPSQAGVTALDPKAMGDALSGLADQLAALATGDFSSASEVATIFGDMAKMAARSRN